MRFFYYEVYKGGIIATKEIWIKRGKKNNSEKREK